MIQIAFIELAWWQALLAAFVAIVGAGRLTRLITVDEYPPVVWLRMKWDAITNDGPWSKMIHCLWCLSPWVFLLALGTFLLTFVAPWMAWTWWLFWGWLAGSYVVAEVVYWDEGRGETE